MSHTLIESKLKEVGFVLEAIEASESVILS